MGKTKKRVSVLVLVAAALMMFSVAALADTVHQFSYTYNSQTLTSVVVTKSNNNTEAKATSLARGNGITSNVFSNGGTIAAIFCAECRKRRKQWKNDLYSKWTDQIRKLFFSEERK